MNPNVDAATWTQCMFFLTRKRRFCNMARCKGHDFCGVHVNGGVSGLRGMTGDGDDSGGSSGGAAKGDTTNLERVSCPLDPSHSVYASALASHLKVCNAAKAKRVLEARPYYRAGANSGRCCGGGEVEGTMELDDAALLAKVEALYAQHVGGSAKGPGAGELPSDPPPSGMEDDAGAKPWGGGGIPLVYASAAECGSYLAASASAEGATRRRAARRHLLQQASLVAGCSRRGLLGRDGCFVEMGAGRGMLGLALRAAVGAAAPVVLVERAPVRNKADRDFRKDLALSKKAAAAEKQPPQPEAAAVTEAKGGDGQGDGERLKRKRLDSADGGSGGADDGADGGGGGSDGDGGGGFERARVDIRDVSMAGLPHAGRPCVVVAKHLCGVATDLALRALLTRISISTGSTDGARSHSSKSSTGGDAAGAGGGLAAVGAGGDLWPGRDAGARLSGTADATAAAAALATAGVAADLGVRGVCIATCCHHCCNWDDYVAKGFFLGATSPSAFKLFLRIDERTAFPAEVENIYGVRHFHFVCFLFIYSFVPSPLDTLGLGRADFDRMRKWSGWACNPCGDPDTKAATGSRAGGGGVAEGKGVEGEGDGDTRSKDEDQAGDDDEEKENEHDGDEAAEAAEGKDWPLEFLR